MAGAYDLVIVGMGSGGLVAAEFAATLGLRVAAVERGRPGGDCLWTGCVPSKTLIATARVAQRMRTAGRFGITAVEPEVDTAAVWRRIRAVQEEIAATDDDPERYARLGVDVVAGAARLAGPHRVAVDGRVLEARFILLCTGSRPLVPDLDGLCEVGFLTSENLFALERAPSSLVVIGGGPVGTEMAQAMRRLGLPVTLLEQAPRLLGRDEPELVERLVRVLGAEGVEVTTGATVERVERSGATKVVSGRVDGRARSWEAAEILVAAGRRPHVEGLGLEEAGVAVGPRGIAVDARMRTSAPSVYAAGDAVGRELFTHAAGYQAVRAVRDMFFPGRGRASARIPWCTFTDPELAHAGMTVAEARRAFGERSVEVLRQELTHNDRARADGETVGAIVVVSARGRVVGAHILAPAAGEMIGELALAIERRMRVGELASVVPVYPTLSTGVGQLAASVAFAAARRWRWLLRVRARQPGTPRR